MANSDIYNATLIIIIFTILMGSLSLTITLAELRKKWDRHRCNPLIMPIAGNLNPEISTSENFKYCVQDIQTKFMEIFLTPFTIIVQYLQQLGFTFINIFSYLKDILNTFGLDIDNLFNYFNDIIAKLISKFENALTELTDIIGNVTTALEDVQKLYTDTLTQIEEEYNKDVGVGALIVSLEETPESSIDDDTNEQETNSNNL